jgi:23S rRNA (pseudouridine1915-N3)-methyltransferase
VIRRATIVAVGKLKGWAVEGCDDYLSRLRRYFPVEVVEVPEGDMNRRTTEEVLAAEGERFLKRIPAGAHVVALDRGEENRSLRRSWRGGSTFSVSRAAVTWLSCLADI